MNALVALYIVMKHHKLRVIFKAPVPYIHNTLTRLLIPWTITYLAYLPDFYWKINGTEWRDHGYTITNMFSMIICLSIASWLYLAYLQKKVNQYILQPIVLLLPTCIMLWYAFTHSVTAENAFTWVFITESLVLTIYYVTKFPAFIHDIKTNYSSISDDFMHGIYAQWCAVYASFIAFLLSAYLDNIVWDIINVLINMLTLFLFIYSSEHMVPLPETEADDDEKSRHEEKEGQNLTNALFKYCEEPMLFCTSDLSLQDLALAIGTNRTYLSKWFVENDTTFYTYINGLRIEYAAKLLRTTTNPVTHIQIASGFTSKTTFRKYFQDHYGCTPTEYREQGEGLK